MRRLQQNTLFWLLGFFLLAFSGCGDTKGAASNNETESFTFGGSLYVTNSGDGRLLVFDPLVTSSKSTQSKIVPRVPDGNISPDRQFPEALSGPAGVFLDRTNDVLYVANSGQNAIQIYDNASTLTSPIAASRLIVGDQTRLNEPFAVTFDAVSGRLFVANRGGNAITTYHTECITGTSLEGNIAPCNLLVGDQTQLDFPRGLAVDSVKNLLYISNSGGDSILVYENANTVGAAPASCVSDFSNCNIPPARVISPHEGSLNESKLELPFGITLDIPNDRLYVANSGFNHPGILIYEGASALNGAVEPERVISGLNTQLSIPAGIDVEPARGRILLVNNNSSNNVNVSSGNNVDSPSLVIFNDIDSTCPTTASQPCNLLPDLRLGGDVSTEAGSTLSSPVGLAFDPTRDITYIANTGANNIFVYDLAGDTAPLKENRGPLTSTLLNVPSGAFYDLSLDRLYLSNSGNGLSSPSDPIIVYNNVSEEIFEASEAPDWTIRSTSLRFTRGVYIDKTRNIMIVIDGSTSSINFGLLTFDLTQNFTAGSSPVAFPIDDAAGPAGSEVSTVTLQAPSGPRRGTDGLTAGGPTAMAVDEARGEVYVTDKNNNSVVVFSLPASPSDPLLKVREITGLKQPYGVFIDTSKDILYITNNGVATGDSADNTVYVYDNASTKADNDASCPTSLKSPCRPDRIISTEGFIDEQKKLKAPISPFVDQETNRLYVIKSAAHTVGSVAYPEAVLTFQDASMLGDASEACINDTGTCADADSSKVKVLSGDATQLSFWQDAGTTPLRRYTGSVFISKHKNNETMYVAQSAQKDCVSGCTGGALLVYGIEGRVPPSQVWSSGGSGGFTTPEALLLDPVSNILYVANQDTNTLSILPNADQIDISLDVSTGKRDVAGIGLNRPAGIAVHNAQNRLYISNSASLACTAGDCNAILRFDNPSALTGGGSPDETISDTGLNQPKGLAMDAVRDRLYAASHGNDAILVFSIISGSSATRSVMLNGAQSQLNKPVGVAIDSGRDLLYVLNQGGTNILVFENASSLSATASPVRVISGSDGNGNNFMVDLSAIVVDPGKDLLYVADRGANAVYMFPDASTADGQPTFKTLSGDKTGLLAPSAITVNTASP